MIVRHIASQTSMKLTGPDASAPMLLTGAPRGRSVEKSWPMPPPACIVSAASLTLSKMLERSSAIRAENEAVEERDVAVGAGACDDPPRRLKAEVGHRVVKSAGPGLLWLSGFSTDAAAVAIRRKVSSIVSSAAKVGDPAKRYLRRQIASETTGRR